MFFFQPIVKVQTLGITEILIANFADVGLEERMGSFGVNVETDGQP